MLNPSWNYSWGTGLLPEQPENSEYIPMTWGKSKTLSNYESYINSIRLDVEKGNLKRILAFNEPDKEAQANMSVESALVRSYFESLVFHFAVHPVQTLRVLQMRATRELKEHG